MPHWADANEHLIDLAGAVPAGKWNWSPEPRFWNFRGIFLHIIAARYYTSKDEGVPDFWRLGQTTEGVKEHLRLSWEALSRFLIDPAALDGPDPLIDEGPDPSFRGPDYRYPDVRDGHYVAWHRMVHDIHHRADILHYLDVLGVDLSGIPRRAPL
ncbi:MAG: hypothetical protein WEC75_03985 [Dehalococcoidia bacterium]